MAQNTDGYRTYWQRNRRWIIMSSAILGFIFVMFLVTKRIQVEAGLEAVLVDKPFWTIFGKGGVRPDPLTSGAKWVFYTTDAIAYDVRPKQHTEVFKDEVDGTITSDNIPIDFNAYIKVRPILGMTPRLHSLFGPTWYEQNLKEVFRTAVRDEVSKTPMTALTTRQLNTEGKDILGEIQRDVLKEMRDFVKAKGIDAEVMEVIVGKATPPQSVLISLANTANEQQRAKTEDERAKAEKRRAEAETERAIADNAYRNKVGFDSSQFLQLEIAKKQVEAIQACGKKEACTAIVGALGIQPTIPLK